MLFKYQKENINTFLIFFNLRFQNFIFLQAIKKKYLLPVEFFIHTREIISNINILYILINCGSYRYKFEPLIQSHSFNTRLIMHSFSIDFPRSWCALFALGGSSICSRGRFIDAMRLFGGERDEAGRSERRDAEAAARRGGARAIPGNRLPGAMRGPRAAPALAASSWVATVTS